MEEAYKEWQDLEEQTGVKLVKYDHRQDYDDDAEWQLTMRIYYYYYYFDDYFDGVC